MNLFDLVGFLSDSLTRSAPDRDRIDDEVIELAETARSDTITRGALGRNDHTRYPLVEYLEGDEQPEYVYRAGELLIGDESGSLGRKHPSQEQRVLVSDRRVLFVLGNRVSDQVMEVPLESVVDAYLDTESARHYLVVDANRDDDEMTFFADVTLEENVRELRSGVEYITDCRVGTRPDGEGGEAEG